MNPPVTVLMPVKNGMPYLEETLASIAAQTYQPMSMLAWDNGSTDGTVELLRQWIPHRITGRAVVDQPMSLGQCRATMVQTAETELCAFFDADDYFFPDRLTKQVEFLQTHPQVGLIGTQVIDMSADGQTWPTTWTLPTEDAEIRWRFPFGNALLQGTCMFKRSLFLKVGNYRDIKPGQDYDLFLRLIRHTEMANLPDRLMKYRRHEKSVSAIGGVPGHVMNRQLFERYAEQLFPDLPRHAALELHHALVVDLTAPVRWDMLKTLRDAAVNLAEAVGKPHDYFTGTQRYKHQYRNLITRNIKQIPGINSIWNTAKTLLGRG